MKTTEDKKNWLKGTDAARYAGISRRQLTNWMLDGLPARHLSARHILIRAIDIDAFIESRSNEYATRAGLKVLE